MNPDSFFNAAEDTWVRRHGSAYQRRIAGHDTRQLTPAEARWAVAHPAEGLRSVQFTGFCHDCGAPVGKKFLYCKPCGVERHKAARRKYYRRHDGAIREKERVERRQRDGSFPTCAECGKPLTRKDATHCKAHAKRGGRYVA